MSKVELFAQERKRLMDQLLEFSDQEIKRFISLDAQVYREDVLSKKTKEMLGLVSSIVLRCDDCINYHLKECFDTDLADEELEEVFSIALIVGGSITIPHLRRAVDFWKELKINYLKTNKKQYFDRLQIKLERLLSKEQTKAKVLKDLCILLEKEIPYYTWVGFYLTDGDTRELVLGPFVGEPTEHTRIKFGEGICGQAAEKEETFIIQDVTKESNYLSCSLKVKSEIVIPIFAHGKVVGELDIDSHDLNPFTAEDQQLLEAICQQIGKLYE